MSNKQIAGAGYEGEVVYGCTVAENEVGKWKKYSYDITVSEAMVTNGANLLELRLSGFGQQSDGSVSANLYFDDISSVEYIEGAAVTLSVDQSAVISNSRLEDTGSILIDRKVPRTVSARVTCALRAVRNMRTRSAQLFSLMRQRRPGRQLRYMVSSMRRIRTS